MAARLEGAMTESLNEKIRGSKILIVGAGGIGCELLKNLVLTGFEDIDIIDLDTIDVSNLNRQFLFHKQHVGMSKAKVAKENASTLNPNVKIKAHHDSITSAEYGVSFFKQFTVVMNALDNRTARNHVNRMCLAADIPLIESGTSGFLGQVTVIKKEVTECYECQPKGHQKTYPGCTIRNTPSEPIHCIVWAKHLFNQLFGEADPDEDVSPDSSDPNAVGNSNLPPANDGNVSRLSTRTWAESCDYDTIKLFDKLFHDDIKYLLQMDKLWQKRRPPTPLDWTTLPDAVACSSKMESLLGMRDQHLWSVKECATVFAKSVGSLGQRIKLSVEGNQLVWDKDDDVCMDFVTACANIRAHIFGIPQKNRFDVKSMAGNIVPAIATTNAVIGGLIVMEALKVLENRLSDCNTVYLSRQPHPKNRRLLAVCALDRPNPNCYVCCSKPEVSVKLDTETFTVKMLEEKILKTHLNMVAPDVELDDGKGTILISSEEGETEENNDKILHELKIKDGARLKCDDFLQNYQIVINIVDCKKLEDEKEFEVVGTVTGPSVNNDDGSKDSNRNGDEMEDLSDDDLQVVDDEDDTIPTKKRKHELSVSPNGEDMTHKKLRLHSNIVTL